MMPGYARGWIENAKEPHVTQNDIESCYHGRSVPGNWARAVLVRSELRAIRTVAGYSGFFEDCPKDYQTMVCAALRPTVTYSRMAGGPYIL